MCPPRPEPAKTYVVSFTEHTVYELVVRAASQEAAIEQAIHCRNRRGLGGFRLAEKDDTDWDAVEFRSEAVSMIDQAPAPPASSTPAPRYMSSQELQTVVRLLRELRDLTQSQSSFDDAGRMIALILNVDGAR